MLRFAVIVELSAMSACGRAESGHLFVGLGPSGQVIFRLQAIDAETYRCSAPIAASEWTHVAVSFGGSFALWIDHAPATGTTYDRDGELFDCTLPHAAGLAGNANALVLGAASIFSADGDPDPTPADRFFAGGQLDQLHIRSTWRDFGAP